MKWRFVLEWRDRWHSGGQWQRYCGLEYTPGVNGRTLAEGKRMLSAVKDTSLFARSRWIFATFGEAVALRSFSW